MENSQIDHLVEAKNAAESMANDMLKRKKEEPKEDIEEGTDEIMKVNASDDLAQLEDSVEADEEIVIGGRRRRKKRRSRKSRKGGAKRKYKKGKSKRKSRKGKSKTNDKNSEIEKLAEEAIVEEKDGTKDNETLEAVTSTINAV